MRSIKASIFCCDFYIFIILLKETCCLQRLSTCETPKLNLVPKDFAIIAETFGPSFGMLFLLLIRLPAQQPKYLLGPDTVDVLFLAL